MLEVIAGGSDRPKNPIVEENMPSSRSENWFEVDNWAWLADFWTKAMRPAGRRRWHVAILCDGDLSIRDGFAYAHLVRAFGARPVAYRFIRAWQADRIRKLPAEMEVLFLGRPKPFGFSELGPIATTLERSTLGRFLDASTGTTGDAVRYHGEVFRQDVVEGPPHVPYRRCTRDYAVLMCHVLKVEGAWRRTIAIAGLGMLGTLALTIGLTDPQRRTALASEVAELIPKGFKRRRARAVEICVEVTLDDEHKLAEFLSTPDFRFRPVAVAVDDVPAFVHVPTERQFEISTSASDETPGWLRMLPNRATVPLVPRQHALMRTLITHPEGVSRTLLRQELNGGRRIAHPLSPAERRAMAELVFFTNRRLTRHFRWRPEFRLIRYRRAGDAYYLHRAEGRVRDA